ncbi:MAG: alginate lyase family protein [Acidobacteriota bacterium]|nr:alginate lyase family protein [Acidobacteriota bacterium]
MKSEGKKLVRVSTPSPAPVIPLFCGLILCLCTPPAVAAPGSGQGAQPGPATTDAEIIQDLNLDFPGMEKVKAAVAANNLGAAKRAYLEFRRTASTTKWTIMPSAMPANPTETDDAIGDELILHHIRNTFYGFFPHEGDMGKNFDWTYNPVDPHDPRYSMEWTWCVISRTQFWEQLADAYWKTHNEKYAREWVAELEDFAAKNPRTAVVPADKPSLWRTLDSAIRMDQSWPYAYYHFLRSPSFTPEAQWTYLKEMQDHAILFENGFRDPRRTGNWVATELSGLYTIAVLYPELKESAHWRELVMERMSLELSRMVPPDGMEIELTPGYHMVALDGFLGPLMLAKLNNIQVPDKLLATIMSMYRALVIAMDQSGHDVATNDSGPLDAVAAARQGLQLAYDPLLDWAVSGGKQGKGLPDSTVLPYAGFYMMRGGWQPDDLFLFFRAGPPGTGHEHQDMLQVVMKGYGKMLLLEPGTGMYDHSDWRRFIRGTASHNTIIVDGKWQNRGENKAPVTEPAHNPWITTPLFDYVAGTYDRGYQKNIYDQSKQYAPEDWVGPVDHSVTHTRRVIYLRPYYALLLDTIDGTGTHEIDSHFNVDSPSVRIDPATQAAFSQNQGDVQIGLYPLERDHLKVSVIQGEHGAPDIKWGIPTVDFSKNQAVPAVFATFLYPYKGEQPKFTAEPLAVATAGIWAQRIHTAKEDMDVAIVKYGSAKSFSLKSSLAGKVETSSDGLVLRRAANQQSVLAGGWGLSSFASKGLQFTTDAPADLLICLRAGHPALMNAGSEPIHVIVKKPFEQRISLLPSNAIELGAQGAERISDTSIFALPPDKSAAGQP